VAPLVCLAWAGIGVTQAWVAEAAGRAASLWGNRPTIVGSWILTSAAYAGMVLLPGVAAAVSAVAAAVLTAASEGAEKALVAERAGATERGTAFGFFTLLSALGGACGQRRVRMDAVGRNTPRLASPLAGSARAGLCPWNPGPRRGPLSGRPSAVIAPSYRAYHSRRRTPTVISWAARPLASRRSPMNARTGSLQRTARAGALPTGSRGKETPGAGK
jgi:hypothetical protein